MLDKKKAEAERVPIKRSLLGLSAAEYAEAAKEKKYEQRR